MVSRVGGAATGALTGAATGASLGSIVPGIGTGLGAIGGGLIGGLSGYFGSTPDEYGQVNLQTPEQQDALSQLLGMLTQSGGEGGNYQLAQSYLGSLLNRDPAAYDRFAAPYLQEFEQQTIPRISQRFEGLGGGLGGGIPTSSGFGQALGGSAAQLQSDLARRFSELQYGAAGQASNQYNNLANLGLNQRAFQPTYQPGSTGIAGGLGQGLASGLGQQAGKTLMETLQNFLKNKATGTDPQNASPQPGQNPFTGKFYGGIT